MIEPIGHMHTSLLNNNAYVYPTHEALYVSDNIYQLLSHHAENILRNLQIEPSCHSGHYASLPCSAYEIASRNMFNLDKFSITRMAF